MSPDKAMFSMGELETPPQCSLSSALAAIYVQV